MFLFVCLYLFVFVVIGFNVTELNFTPNDAGKRVFLHLLVEKSVASQGFLQVSVNSEDFSRSRFGKEANLGDFELVLENCVFYIGEINEFVDEFPITDGRFSITFPSSVTGSHFSYTVGISTRGNSRALEEPLQFAVRATAFIQTFGDIALILSQPIVDITVADLDGK